jgi:hypothetical protein
MAGLLASTANAAPINGSPTGIASPAYTITFSEVALTPGVTQVTNQFAAYGAIFSPAVTYSPQEGFPNLVGDTLGNFSSIQDSNYLGLFSIRFTTLQSDAAFAMGGNDTDFEFEALLGNTIVEAFTANVGVSGNNFYGFTGSSFDAIRIVNLDESFWLIDNIQLGAGVPEPASWAMLIAGFGLTGAAMRRRRVAVAA